jgi:glyoxylase-like metal-dependent hydrolase (beta-lactamase superfamily II)/uncharacterized protein with ACT and thioredoxin-like domain
MEIIGVNRFSFVTRMPDEPGTLHKTAEIVQRYNGNIDRIHYDRRIDSTTVFFEVTADEQAYLRIKNDLHEIGYLQESLNTASFLKWYVYLPNHSGALFGFLNYITAAGANIAYIDFDDRGKHPERLTVSLNVEQAAAADELLNQLKSRYRLEILEYDTTGKHLDDTVFYVRFAQSLRELIGDAEDEFLLRLLYDINHIVQELNALGEDPEEVFENILRIGRALRDTSGDGFSAEVQRFEIREGIELYCFQLPCGGNVFLFHSPDETVMIDTGYGSYYRDIQRMFRRYGFCKGNDIDRIYVTHADADHCGGAGYYRSLSYLHRGSLEIIQRANRAYGSRSESSILEEVYTTIINLFSVFNPPKNFTLFPEPPEEKVSVFPVLSRFTIRDLEFRVLESLGGHIHGQVYLYCPELGILFTGDTLINFDSLDEERRKYNSIADFLVTSVNVDSDRARVERKELLELIAEQDRRLAPSGRRCLVCGGHGAVSVLEGKKLVAFGAVEKYTAIRETLPEN